MKCQILFSGKKKNEKWKKKQQQKNNTMFDLITANTPISACNFVIGFRLQLCNNS